MRSGPFIIYIVAILFSVGVAIRGLPFVFSKKLSESALVTKLGQFLPPAIMILLLLHSLKDIKFLGPTHGIPEIFAVLLTAFLHFFKRNAFLSIVGGTAFYMILIRQSPWA